VRTIEERQSLKIGCVEEIAYRMGYIDGKQLRRLAETIKTNYGSYLMGVVDEQ